jgi:hypothetical protein
MNGLEEAWRGVRMALDAAGVRFAIGGSWASTSYGEPRLASNIDLVAGFTELSLGQFVELLGDDLLRRRRNRGAGVRSGAAV